MLTRRTCLGWVTASIAMAAWDCTPLAWATPLTPSADGEFMLPPLPYDYSALAPHIDEQTMRLHHDKHHAAYVKNLNGAIARYPTLKGKSLESLLQDLKSVPQDIRKTLRNNGGGHLNHSLFWQIMGPKAGGEPVGAIAAAIQNTFGSFAEFQQQFVQAGLQRFGSGWVWLVLTPQGKLKITDTANQDSPVMEGDRPILGNDLWEHAYYLTYQNRRADYLKAWWNVVNWQAVEGLYQEAITAAIEQ